MKPDEIDMESIAAPLAAKYNKARRKTDTWEFKAEYLEGDTFIVNATGYCRRARSYERRDEAVADLAWEIAAAADAATDADTPTSERWSVWGGIDWTEDGEELDGYYTDTDSRGVPYWRLSHTAQLMLCRN